MEKPKQQPEQQWIDLTETIEDERTNKASKETTLKRKDRTEQKDDDQTREQKKRNRWAIVEHQVKQGWGYAGKTGKEAFQSIEDAKSVEKREEQTKEFYEELEFLTVSKIGQDKVAIADKAGRYQDKKNKKDHVIVTLDQTDHFTLTHSECNTAMEIKVEEKSFGNNNTQVINVKCNRCKTKWREWRKNNVGTNLIEGNNKNNNNK